MPDTPRDEPLYETFHKFLHSKGVKGTTSDDIKSSLNITDKELHDLTGIGFKCGGVEVFKTNNVATYRARLRSSQLLSRRPTSTSWTFQR